MKTRPLQYEVLGIEGFNKFYCKDTLFNDVDWSNWDEVVQGFRTRFDIWYFEPLRQFPKTGHEPYPVLCTMCSLIETFAHYTSPNLRAGRKEYKRFLRDELDGVFSTKLSREIPMAGKEQNLKDFADVFYTGVRCSLLHHGDLAQFAGMTGSTTLAYEKPRAAKSNQGDLYPVVIFEPWILRDRLCDWFDEFCKELRNNPRGSEATVFAKSLREDYLVPVSTP